jgi:hypothetical protein
MLKRRKAAMTAKTHPHAAAALAIEPPAERASVLEQQRMNVRVLIAGRHFASEPPYRRSAASIAARAAAA